MLIFSRAVEAAQRTIISGIWKKLLDWEKEEKGADEKGGDLKLRVRELMKHRMQPTKTSIRTKCLLNMRVLLPQTLSSVSRS